MGASYNAKCDTFSFGLIVYEMASGELPYTGYSLSDFKVRVVEGKEKPDLPLCWPPEMRTLISTCWAHDPAKRPTMEHVLASLEGMLEKCINREEGWFDDVEPRCNTDMSTCGACALM